MQARRRRIKSIRNTATITEARELHASPKRRSADLGGGRAGGVAGGSWSRAGGRGGLELPPGGGGRSGLRGEDRKSTRLNSSHVEISYAVFCLKKTTTHLTNFARSVRRGSANGSRAL